MASLNRGALARADAVADQVFDESLGVNQDIDKGTAYNRALGGRRRMSALVERSPWRRRHRMLEEEIAYAS